MQNRDGRGYGGIGIRGIFSFGAITKKYSFFLSILMSFLYIRHFLPFTLLLHFYKAFRNTVSSSFPGVLYLLLFLFLLFSFSLLTQSFSFAGSASGVHFSRRCMAF